MIPDNIKDKILSSAKLVEIISDFHKLEGTGKTLYTECPMCGKTGKGKGLKVTESKKVFKCFSCGFGGNTPVSFLMEAQKMTYPEALEYIADKYSIAIIEEPLKGPQRPKGKKEVTYRDKQLKSSGLSDADQKALVVLDDNTRKEVDVYQAGTRDQWGRIVPGDDMIIWYFGLDGKPIQFQKPKSTKFEDLYRVRYQFPDAHLDKSGRPIKYQSPPGSGSHLYIPQLIRNAYNDRRVINRLYIQEGEKKTDKACKHGIPSVGIMGIHNIGRNGQLPQDLQLIVHHCNVSEIVFVQDADWDHLSEKLSPGDRVDQRPFSFFNAVKNYRDYMKAFSNAGIYIEIYFAHIIDNGDEKGIDDLLAGSLMGEEVKVKKDFDKAINGIKEDNGTGEYVQVHKITTVSDLQIMQLWSLQSSKKFLEKYDERLREAYGKGEIFKIGKMEWRLNLETEEFEAAQPLTPNEQYWEEITWEDARGQEKKKLLFDYVNLKNFLANRGFGRVKMVSGQYVFVRSQGRIIEQCEAGEVKDYVMEFTEEIAPKDVQNMLLRGGKMYLGPDSLSNMRKIYPLFEKPHKDYQTLYFKNCFWKISASGVKSQSLQHLESFIWQDKINDFDADLISEPLIDIEQFNKALINKIPIDRRNKYKKFEGMFDITITDIGKKCDFLQFLFNTSEFNWRKQLDSRTRRPLPEDGRSLEDKFETNQHFMAKLSAMGYLLHSYHNASVARAVICMDGKMSEVGASNGRSGKSLFGKSIEYVIPQLYVGAKNKKLTEDPFLFEGVTEKTKNVFFDDVRANIDIEHFFAHITGKFAVRPLGEKRFTLPEYDKPKLTFATNHAIMGEGGSFKDRLALLAFSDFYNDHHKPIDDFHHNFFDDWDKELWNLFYNFMALCLQVYLKYGFIKPPSQILEMRRLRQMVGEDLLSWADEYFSNPTNIGMRIPRKELTDDFLEKNPKQKRYITPPLFKKKLKYYCEFRGYRFNPQLYDATGYPLRYDKNGRGIEDDKSGGVEYFTIGEIDKN